ncbi:hypothetical protein [Spiroplasma apis]|uniref:Uncharacterized protein n=1 Tax=Spiroplasma apis B31 TaxID=1276258 RepID=V5RIR7_SPIAP|nr:hypothetical protein [Spiroplasma apis]AHB36378.1 hypothetical protein SAPIS_v1c05330 [Spiroplasma apis B31]
MEKCLLNGCGKAINQLSPKRVYKYDENIEDEVAVPVCDECYDNDKKEENDIDWLHSVEE